MSWPLKPPEGGIGVACANCFGPGKKFGDIPTPLRIDVAFSMIEHGALWIPADGTPPNTLFTLAQNTPCSWQYTSVPRDIIVTLFLFAPGFFSFLLVTTIAGQKFFESLGRPICTRYFTNDLAPGGNHFTGGAGMLAFDCIPNELAEEYNFTGDKDIRWNFWPVDIDTAVVQLTDANGKTSIKFLYDET